MRQLCECGRRPLALRRHVRHLKRMKDHTLCARCWAAQRDSNIARQWKEWRMNESYDDLDRFGESYTPQAGFKPGIDAIPPGFYDFEITDAALGKAGNPPETVFRIGLRVLSGEHANIEIEKTYFFSKQEAVDRFGGEMVSLGLADAAKWGRNGKRFSEELQAAIPRLKGGRFRGRRVDKQGSEKMQSYLNILSVLARPPIGPARTPAPAKPAPVPVAPDGHDIF